MEKKSKKSKKSKKLKKSSRRKKSRKFNRNCFSLLKGCKGLTPPWFHFFLKQKKKMTENFISENFRITFGEPVAKKCRLT